MPTSSTTTSWYVNFIWGYSVRARTTLLATALGCLTLSTPGRAQEPPSADTVDDTSGVLSGQAMPGINVMSQPCLFGDTFHYQITGQGELRLEGPIACAGITTTGKPPNGIELLCHLDTALRCTAPTGNGAAPVDYAVDENGVTVGAGKPLAWANQQQAVALFPAIRDQAQKK